MAPISRTNQQQHIQQIRNISEIIKDRQVTLLGHILRLEDGAPEKAVIFHESLNRNVAEKKKSGKTKSKLD